ncbi:MAG: hypothetical protein AB2A00_11835 [Myxococcota bacterium]
MTGGLLPALLLLLAPLSGEVRARVTTGPEADSNARRDISGEAPRADLLWRSQLWGLLAHQEAGQRVGVEAQLGAKLFQHQRTEDLLVSELRARHETRLLSLLGTFAEVSARDRRQRSGLRTYSTASAEAGLVLGPVWALQFVVGGGPRGFIFWPDNRFHHAGASLSGSALLRFTDAELASASTGLDGRVFPQGYPAVGEDEQGQRTFDKSDRRRDGSAWGELSVESVRALYLRAALRVSGNVSNSRGEAYARARLGLTAGLSLPGGVRLLADTQLQATRWPEGLGLGERLALQESDENQTSASVQVSVPLAGGLWLEGRTAAYTAELSAVRTPFLRFTALLALGYRL